MSLNDTSMSDDASGSIEVKEGEQDVTMKNSSASAHTGYETDAPGDGEVDMLQIIQILTTYLSSVREE